MADSSPYTKPHFPLSDHSSRIQPKPTNQGKSCSGFILKVLFLALFVAVLPLFPSQAPDFVSQTILNKFWELLHLLFIGIAVTYGLFSRRNSELDTTHTELETTHSSANDSTAAAPSYVSKVFPASSNIFYDNGCDNENGNSCEVDEKMVHCWNNQYFDGGPGGVCSNGGGTVGVFDEQYKTHLPISEDSFGYSVRCDGNGIGTGVVQAWNSEYYHSEPVVVVAQPNCNTGECGEVVDYKPLGLPIRSLRSVARDVDSSRYANESDSSSVSRGSSSGLGKSGDREFGDLGPSNLEKKFNDAAAAGGSASAIPWCSTNRWTEREKTFGNVTSPSHFRPLSADETKFEALSSGSMQSTTSFSSHTNMYSSLDSILLDNMNFQEEEMRLKEASYVSASEKMNFQEEDVGQRKTSFVPVSEIMNFQEEDMGPWKTSYAPASENTNFRERDSRKKIFQGSSSRNRKMATKGKYGAASFPSHFRPMSVDETQFDSLGSNSNAFEAVRSFSSNARMYSSLDSISSDMDFQEEDMGQKKTSHMHTSENMNFQEDMGHKKTSYVHDSENVNFQEEDMEQKKTSYVPASENRNFQEVDLGKSSQVSSSGNGMIESKGKYAGDSRPSYFRPMSVDETQLESLSSRSFQSMGSFSSQSSLCSSLDSALSENMNSPKEEHGSSSSSPSPLARRNGEASLQAFQARGYTNGSSPPDDIKSSLNGELRGLNEIEGEDPPGKKESRIHVLQSDSEKPARVAKAPSQGKSVRTRRASGLTSGTMRIGETSSKQTDEKGEKNGNNVESVMRKDRMKSREPDLPLKGVSKKTLDSYCPKPEIKFSNHHRRDKLESSKNLSKQDSDIELENTQVSSYENGVPECVNDSDLDSEVDKKASEFIAKFKAQIRLQKIGSIERSKEQKITQNKIR
ncbi:hypothetical protein JHK82_026050 [Glycine max]|uniref:Uncharacterized protein n=1 Tax=Glycine max TaxID=3847 RepID=A0A0R0IJB7_SOYBN|nr:uncharacterized protein LOC102664801 [Glycine max]KAG5008117.1 hypothetical protein JHK85_026659 [Glycine max]KAG5134862.1 hypothetical protein JHK82_026050 [Glycine max]KRH40152.1 hypothetical protein GLYMA_09G241900v4 [Glycine max]|eukprot:XP_006588325.1 uncharacterized protein LOC102664801 [Glycine max]